MKIIIQHDSSCPESVDGQYRWQLNFEAMQRESRKDFDQMPSMRLHAEKWAELARNTGCNCGAKEEMIRREKEEAERYIEVPAPGTGER
jgi:hypothetical protein